jgi:heat shock protein HslJ
LRRLPWLVLAWSLAACGVTPPPPKAGPVGAWDLSEFRLDTHEPTRQPEAPFTLILDKEGGASGQVGCNHWQGRYSTALGRLFLEKVAVGRERCLIDDPDTSRLERLFLSRLESGASYRTEGDGMELTFADELQWRFRRQ